MENQVAESWRAVWEADLKGGLQPARWSLLSVALFVLLQEEVICCEVRLPPIHPGGGGPVLLFTSAQEGLPLPPCLRSISVPKLSLLSFNKVKAFKSKPVPLWPVSSPDIPGWGGVCRYYRCQLQLPPQFLGAWAGCLGLLAGGL